MLACVKDLCYNDKAVYETQQADENKIIEIDELQRGENMKEGIHPDYYQATVTCNCGTTFVTGSTKQEIHVEVCSKCHSFYTGQQKSARTDGRIDKFNKKYGVTNK